MSNPLAAFSTPVVSDAMDMLGLDGGCEGLVPMGSGLDLTGEAFTVQFAPSDGLTGAADYIDLVPPGKIVVLANEGRCYCTVWGDLLTQAALHRGIAGTVIDGCCRDVGAIRRLGYPLFARGVFMKTGKRRVRMVACEVPVSICNQSVEPGDIIRADANGVLVVTRAHVEEVAEFAAKIEAAEADIARDIAAGIPLAEARRRRGYHAYSRPS